MKLLASLIFCVSLATTCWCQAKYSTTIKLEITAPDRIKNEVQSYMNRELRALGDVTLVDDHPSWEIRVDVMEITTRGIRSGYAFAFVVTEPLYLDFLKGANCDQKAKSRITNLMENTERLLAFGNRVSPNIESACKKLVADFDSTTLETDRKTWREMNKP
jgi:hypothetical protein